MNEEWKTITGFDGLYEISNKGRLKSFHNNKYGKSDSFKILKPSKGSHGYLAVCLVSLCGEKKTNSIHRLVAEAFIPNPDKLEYVNHKNENKTDNNYNNLEWCTNQYNGEYSCAKHYTLLSPEGEKIVIFNLAKFGRESGLNNSHLNGVFTGKRKSHKGWTKV